MNTEILTRHPEVDDTLRRYVLQRLRGAMRQMSHRIKAVKIKLGALKTQGDQAQRNCVIEIEIDGQPPVVVNSDGPHWLQAIDKAVESAARAIRRKLKATLRGVTPVYLIQGKHAS